MADFAYNQGETPKTYMCGTCHKTGVKLWRLSNTFFVELMCSVCACNKAKVADTVDADGYRKTSWGGGKTDQIGMFIPAVPMEDGGGYWWYSTVPQEGVAWWRNLPTR